MLEAVVITEMDRSYLRNVRTHDPKGFSFFFFFILNWATNPLVVGSRLKKKRLPIPVEFRAKRWDQPYSQLPLNRNLSRWNGHLDSLLLLVDFQHDGISQRPMQVLAPKVSI